MKKIRKDKRLVLVLQATRDITVGEELRYDYGVKGLPWRQKRGMFVGFKIYILCVPRNLLTVYLTSRSIYLSGRRGAMFFDRGSVQHYDTAG